MGIDLRRPLPLNRLKYIPDTVEYIDVLRLDLLHDTISGNKWFKLKYNIEAMRGEGKKGMVSFGGAYSNHLHALAYAGYQLGFATVGMVRGEAVMNECLSDCVKWGMELHFMSRSEYRNKNDDLFLEGIRNRFSDYSIVPEGGDNELGARGCEEIMEGVNMQDYDVVCVSVGSGTTLRGISSCMKPGQMLLGFAPMKGGGYLSEKLAPFVSHSNWRIIDRYALGGFGVVKQDLRDFATYFESRESIALDYIYTAKMMYGLYDMYEEHIAVRDRVRVLAIHTGGLQGNRGFGQMRIC